MKKIFKEFSAFLKQGNMIEIATGLLFASAFKDVITSFSKVFLMPIINKLLGFTKSQESLFVLFGIEFKYGEFITSLISFLIIGFVLFLVLKSYNKFIKSEETIEEQTPSELDVLLDIKKLLEKK